ncbi:hypothetical protein SOVF_163120 [Spinacia oleracea]|nr:hypothetical protein SOVF_163120 [Spinacia oleracea]
MVVSGGTWRGWCCEVGKGERQGRFEGGRVLLGSGRSQGGSTGDFGAEIGSKDGEGGREWCCCVGGAARGKKRGRQGSSTEESKGEYGGVWWVWRWFWVVGQCGVVVARLDDGGSGG